MVDAEAEPVGVAVDGGEVVDVEVHRDRPRPPLPRGPPVEHDTTAEELHLAADHYRRDAGVITLASI